MYFYLISVICCIFFLTEVSARVLDFVTENAPPLQYIKNGKVVGKTTQLIHKIAEASNYKANIKIMPWARVYQTALNQKNTFIYPLVRTAERESSFIWIGKIRTLKLSWAKLKSRKDVNINKPEDAKNYKTGVIRADATYNYLIKNGFIKNDNFIVVSELPLLLELLYSEKIDSFIVDIALLKEMAVIKGYDPKQLMSEFDIPQLSYNLYLATNLNTDPEIIEKLKQHFN
jgi:polar amino acid transport system substrate-binding protein